MAKLLLTSMVVMMKPSQQNRPEITPERTLTVPRWPITPANTQAMTRQATKAKMNGKAAPDPRRQSSIFSLVRSFAAIHGLAKAIYQGMPTPKPAAAAINTAR